MKRFKSILAGVLTVLLFFSIFAGAVATFAYRQLRDLPALSQALVDEAYMDAICQTIQQKLRASMGLTFLQPADIEAAVDEASLKSEALAAMEATLLTLSGTEKPEYRYESPMLRQRIEEKLSQYAAENDLVYQEESIDELYELLRDIIQQELLVLSDSFLRILRPVVTKLDKLLTYWFVPWIIAAVLAFGLLLLQKKRPLSSLLQLTSAAYFACFILWIIASVLIRRDYFAQTILTNTALALFLQNVYHVILTNLQRPLLAFTAGLAAMLLVLLLAMAIQSGKEQPTFLHPRIQPPLETEAESE